MTIEFDPINFEVKPALFILDNWQTHDLLSMHHTSFYTSNFIVNGWNVIDRYVPHDLPWCNEWSMKAYDFAEKYSVERSPYRFGLDLTDRLAGTLPEATFFGKLLTIYSPGFGTFPPVVEPELPPFDTPEITQIIIPPGETAFLTWLTISKNIPLPNDSDADKHSYGGGGWENQASLRIFERRSKQIINSKPEAMLYEFINPLDMAIFSLVVTNGTVINSQENDWLYTAMESRLDFIWSEISSKIERSYVSSISMDVLPTDNGEFGKLTGVGRGAIPASVHWAGLLFANNNPWGSTANFTDLGFPPILKYEGQDQFPVKPMPRHVDEDSSSPVEILIGGATMVVLTKMFGRKYPYSSSKSSVVLGNPPAVVLDSYTILFPFKTEFFPEIDISTLEEIVEFLETNPYYLEEIMMTDSPRIKEIHAALEADRYGVHPTDPEKKRFNNLGRYLETLAYATGIAFNEDGKNIPQPESNWVDADYIQTINANQSLRNGQFAVREVNDAYGQRMVCDALFEVRARQITTTTDEQGNLQVASTSPGGAMRVPHIGGIFDTIQDDLTKYWGGGDIMVPKVDGTGIVYYDSMGECLADCLYMLGSHSKSINELQNQSIKSVFLLQEILRALGLPCHVAAVQGVSPSAPGGEGGVMPCPELDEKSPTLASLIGLVLINLSRVVGASIAFREDDSVPPPPPAPDSDPGLGGASA
jgi:hypothetical protein